MLKTSILLLLLTVGFVGTKAQSLKISDPVKYNDYIVEQQNAVGVELLKLIAMFDALPEDKTVANTQLELVITTAKNAVANAQNLKPIDNEFGMRQAAIELFQFYQTTMETDYRTIIDQLYQISPDLALMQEVLARVQTAEAAVDEKFQSAQVAFAKYHNIQLEENELQEEFEDVEGDE